MISSDEARALAEQMFTRRKHSQGPIYVYDARDAHASELLERAQDVVGEIQGGLTNHELVAPSAWHALIFLRWLAKRVATAEEVKRPFDEAFLQSRVVFRGQKIRYDLSPTIHRIAEGERRYHQAAARILCASINELLRRTPDLFLRAFFPSVSQLEADCVLQHYRSSTGPGTPLLDWSFDPLTAVHFATRHALSRESDEAAVYILSFKQTLSLNLTLAVPPLFAGRPYDQVGLFLNIKGTSKLDDSKVLRIRFPVASCVEFPGPEGSAYDPLMPNALFDTLIARSLAYVKKLDPQKCEEVIATLAADIRCPEAVLDGMQLIAPWRSVLPAYTKVPEQFREITFVQEMIIRFMDWVGFRANLKDSPPLYYYDTQTLSILARTSPAVFHLLAKTREHLLSKGRQSDVRVGMIMDAVKGELRI